MEITKGIFELSVADVSVKWNLREWIDNPEVYGEMVIELIQHLVHKVDEYSPDGIGFNYSDEFMEVSI